MLKTEPDYRLICEQGGAVYIGRRNDVILFRPPDSDEELRLFTSALTPHNVFLSCKAAREKFLESVEWQEVNESEREPAAK